MKFAVAIGFALLVFVCAQEEITCGWKKCRQNRCCILQRRPMFFPRGTRCHPLSKNEGDPCESPLDNGLEGPYKKHCPCVEGYSCEPSEDNSGKMRCKTRN
uniref:U52-Theraphotoxin-Sfo1b_1 n=1 Tax=Selenotholus foelschei TaxID=1905327 RepID=A0A482Z7Y9_9ARAC